MNSSDAQPSDRFDDSVALRTAAALLDPPKPTRSILGSIIICAIAGLVIAAASKMGPGWMVPGPPPTCKTPDPTPVENVRPPEPSKPLFLDSALSYRGAR
jgi:hypothetical protein